MIPGVGRGGYSPVTPGKVVKGGVVGGGPGYGGRPPVSSQTPKLPSFGDLFKSSQPQGPQEQSYSFEKKADGSYRDSTGTWRTKNGVVLNNLGPDGNAKQQDGKGSRAPTGGSFDPSGGPGLTNFAQKDPRIEQANQMMDQRYRQSAANEGQMDPYLQESIGNLRTQLGSDQTGRATNRALSSIRDQASGLEEAAKARKAQAGQGGGMSGKIAEAAQRSGARAASDIQLAQQQRRDALTLGGQGILGAPSQLQTQRQQQTNALLGQISGNAGQGGQLALGQQGLGLESWKAAQDVGLRKQGLDQQMALAPYDIAGKQLGLYSQYLGLLNNSGYGGGY